MSFQKNSSTFLPSLSAHIDEYEDLSSGAIHVHLRTNSDLMGFLVAFPTYPTSDNGVAHILEHMSLCGSTNYPVRDPFFSMLKRSTSAFMNAMTYSDRTAYPFATKDEVDFYNLLGVYLDAAFFPTLLEHDFDQEGWRLDVEDDRLLFKGIVLNEMKEIAADPISVLLSKIDSNLFKGTPYEFNSGGDPKHIPSLTHEELLEFHQRHYSPSQAVFMTSGNVDVERFQAVLIEQVMSKLPGREARMVASSAPAWSKPKESEVTIPTYEEGQSNYGYMYSWGLGQSSCPESFIKASLLEYGLIIAACAPVSKAMEAAGFGFPHRINGLSNQAKQLSLHIGMESLTAREISKAKKVIWKAIESAAVEGIDSDVLLTHLRDIKYSQRVIENGFMPHDLDQLCNALPYVFAGKSAATGFNIEEILEKIAVEIQDPQFFKQLVLDLLSNNHRVDTTITGDILYSQKEIEEERARIIKIESDLAPSDIERVLANNRELKTQQARKNDASALPKIDPKDICKSIKPDMKAIQQGDVMRLNVSAGGIVNATVVFDVSALHGTDYWPYLSLYTMLVPQLGIGNLDYEEACTWREKMAPTFEVAITSLQHLDSSMPPVSSVEFIAEGLQEAAEDIGTLLSNSISSAKFDELERICYLVEMLLNDNLQNMTNEGQRFAGLEAAAPHSPVMHLQNQLEGHQNIAFLRSIATMCATETGAVRFAEKIADLHEIIVSSPRRIVCAGDESVTGHLGTSISAGIPPVIARPVVAFDPQGPQPANHMLHVQAQVNYCEMAWKAPKINEVNSAAMDVLAALLTNEILHRLIREEGGAYGARAKYDNINGVFTMSSYRDPRLQKTYEDFEKSIEWVLSADISKESLDEAIITVIKTLDRPKTPFQEAYSAVLKANLGVVDEMRQAYRTAVLRCCARDLKMAATAWLKGKNGSKCAFAGSKTDGKGMKLINIASD